MIVIVAAALLSSILALTLSRWSMNDKIKHVYPPGPKPSFLLGNLLDLPKSLPWITYFSWAKQYGKIMHFNILGQHIIVLNSLDAAIDLLEKRSRIYSDRPLLPVTDFFGFDFHIATMSYGDRWRKHRRVSHQVFRPLASEKFRPVQLEKAQDLLFNLLESPDEFLDHLKTYSAAIVLSTMYGQEIEPKNDPYVKIADETSELMTESFLPGAAFINMFPILMNIPAWFPGAQFKRSGLKCRKLAAVMLNEPFERLRENMNTGKLKPSMMSHFLETNDTVAGSKENESIFKAVATTAYSAGAETTTSALASFILIMILHPEVQLKAQAELNLVVGADRLPEFNDRVSMPYLEAVYRETFRWHPTTPLGVPHATSDNDIYEGYNIPKGATVVSNIWAMSRDPNKYPEPDKFKPERFLETDGKINDDSQIVTFGFGRRICVGRYMADASVWIGMASILAMFNLAKVDSSFGVDIDVTQLYTDGGVCHPRPFRCAIAPRSNQRSAIVQETRNQILQLEINPH